MKTGTSFSPLKLSNMYVSKAQISIIVTCWIFAPKSTRSRAKLMSNDWRKTIVLSTDAFQNHSGGRAQLGQVIKSRQKFVKLTGHTYASNSLTNLFNNEAYPISGNGNDKKFLKKTCEITSSEYNFWRISAIWNDCAFQKHSGGFWWKAQGSSDSISDHR